MTRLPTAQENTALDAMFVPSTTYYLSLHTADPGTTGASEVTGGSYARQPVTFGAASVQKTQLECESRERIAALAPPK